jgi:hypothetical protein
MRACYHCDIPILMNLRYDAVSVAVARTISDVPVF